MKYNKLLDLIIRSYLSVNFSVYSIVKIFNIQFSNAKNTNNLNELTGQELVWFFFNYSREYVFVIGVFQFIAALFLFFNRTKILGILFLFPIIINILLLNIFYEIQAIKSIILYFLLFMVLIFINRDKFIYIYKNLIDIKSNKMNFRELLTTIILCLLLFIVSSIL